MSIFQDFETIRDNIGHEKYDMIENYLDTICTKDNIDKCFKEMNTIWKLQPTKWNDKANQLKQKYGVILLDDVLHKSEEWVKYEDWYNKNHLHRNIKILGTWSTDYDDIRCNAILYQDEKEVANIIVSYDESDIRYSIGDKYSELNEDFVKKALKSLIYQDFDSYLELPKISECSKLLQEIYDNVCESDSTMCHVDDIDWIDLKENYGFEDKDIIELQNEIDKYGLKDVITINEDGYKIVGYGNLETSFNDDRNLNIETSKAGEIAL